MNTVLAIIFASGFFIELPYQTEAGCKLAEAMFRAHRVELLYPLAPGPITEVTCREPRLL